jgi:Carboxypeptidase regulatory-like domain/TonB dependent receptor-like, beta-barrel
MGQNRYANLGLSVALLALGLFTLPKFAFGQTIATSEILGRVTDPSGAAIPDANVTVTNQNTAFKRTVHSDSSGAYTVNGIGSGLYTVIVVKTGFKTYVHTDLHLTASSALQINVTLQLGKVTQSVTVRGATPLINTETAAMSSEATNNTINSLPLAGSTQGGRLAQTYFDYLIPGAAATGGQNASFDGLPNGLGSIRMTVDGAQAADSCCQQLPSPGALAEVKVITYNAPAEYKTPSTVSMFTRGGTNEWHGDAWELYDDKSLEARQFFLPEKQLFHGHTFGGSIGGPIKKNKIFFFTSFEEFRFANLSVSVSPLSEWNVPTSQMLQGDFSQLLDPAFVNTYNNGTMVTVKDPLTGQPFLGNIIPPSRISSVSQYFIKQIWPQTPTLPGIRNNEFINALHPYERDKEDWRVDFNLSPRNTFYLRAGRTGLLGELPTIGFSLANNFNLSQTFPGWSGNFRDTFILSPRATNEFSAGFSRTELSFSSPFSGRNIMSAAGFQNASGFLGLPSLSFTNFSGVSTGSSDSVDQVKSVGDDIAIIKGNHTLKVGGTFSRADVFSASAPSPASFSFSGALSGWDWADFMLGLPSGMSRTLGLTSTYLFQNELGLYAQDSYKIRPNLTLQFGLRYDLDPFPFEKYNKESAYDFRHQTLVVPRANTLKLVVPNWPLAQVPVMTESQAGWPSDNRAMINTSYKDFSPRFGFAWRPRGLAGTVIRGGYGIYRYTTSEESLVAGGSSAFSGGESGVQSLGANGLLTPTIAFPNPFIGFGPTSVFNPTALSYSAVDPNLKLPTLQEYSLTVGHQWHGWGFRGTYFGSLETGIIYASNYNVPRPGHQPFDQSRRPIPNAFNITLYQNGGFNRVNGFQTEVRHPTGHGLTFDGSYTWLKCLGDVTDWTNTQTPTVPPIGSGGFYFRRRFESNCQLPPHQQALFTYVWTLPVGHGQKYLSHAPRILNGFLGGWRVSGATTFQTGGWLTPYYVGVDPSGMTPGVGPQLPDRIANGNLPRGDRNGLTAPFFNTAAFVCPGGSMINGQTNLTSAGCPLSTPENVGRLGNSSPDIIEGPGINTWDLQVGKAFSLNRVREGTKLEFAAQIANPWNHPSFAPLEPVDLSSPSTVGLYSATKEDYIQPFSYGNRKISLMVRLSF